MNAFIDAAERQLTAPTKRRLQAAEKRAREKRNKALRERDQQFQLWQKWHRKQCEALLAGPHHAPANTLIEFLKDMTLEQGAELIEIVERGPWRDSDVDTRYQVLRLIDHHIAHIRECAGLAPFNDALPFSHEPGTVFQILAEVLR
jgi:hypothetical protein